MGNVFPIINSMMKIEHELLNQITFFCTKTGMSDTRFGRESANDHKVVKRLRDGREIRSSTINAIREYIKSYNCKKDK